MAPHVIINHFNKEPNINGKYCDFAYELIIPEEKERERYFRRYEITPELKNKLENNNIQNNIQNNVQKSRVSFI